MSKDLPWNIFPKTYDHITNTIAAVMKKYCMHFVFEINITMVQFMHIINFLQCQNIIYQ